MANFDKRWFNPLYFILNEIIKIPTIREVFVYGGKSSSKTISITQVLVKECFVKQANAIAYRKESAIIPTTLKKSFNLAIDSMWIYPAFDRLDRKFVCTTEYNNTREIIMKGLDDSEKAKGIESYKYVYLDELNQFERSEFEQIELSLRGIPGQKIFGSWNPVDENSWVKEMLDSYQFSEMPYKLPDPNSFVKISSCGKVVLIRTTYKDNYWIVGRPEGNGPNNEYGFSDDNLIREYEALAKRNYNSYKVNVLGEWGKTTYGGEFLKCWRSEKHVDDCAYNPRLAVYLMFDENVNPYFPCGFFQVGGDQKSLRLIDYLALKNPNNTVKYMCSEIIRKLRAWGHTEAVYVGGDPTSQKEDVKQEKGHDLFRLIINELKDFNPRRMSMGAAPSVRMSADFFNCLLESEIYGLNFKADRKCRLPISDYENTKEDKNGKVDKSTVKDPVTHVTYQPWGHFTDLTRYAITQIWSKEYGEFQRGGPETDFYVGPRRRSKHGY